jgi:hypothetical protein
MAVSTGLSSTDGMCLLWNNIYVRALIVGYCRSVYLMFEAYPIVFSVGHGFSAGITGVRAVSFRSCAA